MRGTLQIGEVARRLGLNPKTIRYYEEIGLLPKPKRTKGGYRQYTEADVGRIDFVHQARALGLSLATIQEILKFRDKRGSPSLQIPRLLEEQVARIDFRIANLRQLKHELREISSRFPHGRRTP